MLTRSIFGDMTMQMYDVLKEDISADIRSKGKHFYGFYTGEQLAELNPGYYGRLNSFALFYCPEYASGGEYVGADDILYEEDKYNHYKLAEKWFERLDDFHYTPIFDDCKTLSDVDEEMKKELIDDFTEEIVNKHSGENTLYYLPEQLAIFETFNAIIRYLRYANFKI